MAEKPKRLKHEDRIKALEKALHEVEDVLIRFSARLANDGEDLNLKADAIRSLSALYEGQKHINRDFQGQLNELEKNQLKPNQVVQVACQRQCLERRWWQFWSGTDGGIG